MDIIKNIDLLSVGLAIAGTGVLGFLVFFSNKKSITNKSFLYFSLITICWSTFTSQKNILGVGGLYIFIFLF